MRRPKPLDPELRRAIEATRDACAHAMEKPKRDPTECSRALYAYSQALRAADLRAPDVTWRTWPRSAAPNKTPLRERITQTPRATEARATEGAPQ